MKAKPPYCQNCNHKNVDCDILGTINEESIKICVQRGYRTTHEHYPHCTATHDHTAYLKAIGQIGKND